MATIFKRTRNGRKADKWTISYYDYRDGQRHRREVTGTADVATTRRIAAKLDSEAELRRRGIIDPTAERLAGSGRLPFEQHLSGFTAMMEGRGCTGNHVDRTETFIKQAAEACGFRTAVDIDATKMAGYIGDLRQKNLSARAINARLRAIKSFTRWLWRTDRLRIDPLMTVRLLDAQADRRLERRALTEAECAALVGTTEHRPMLEGMTGPERAMLYRVALGTGFRANEIRSLTAKSFDLDADPPTITVAAGYSKRRRRDVQPIRRDLAELLRPYLAARAADVAVFPVPERSAEVLRKDLRAARAIWLRGVKTRQERRARWKTDFLAVIDASGHVCDFHALRHTYITNLMRSGVHPRIAQTLARHSTITLTMDRYSHVGLLDEAAALDAMPAAPASGQAALRPTGTDGKHTGGEAATADPVQRAVQRADGPGGPRVSAPGTVEGAKESGREQQEGQRKSSREGKLDTPRHRLSPSVRSKKGGGPRWIRTTDQGIMSPLLYR